MKKLTVRRTKKEDRQHRVLMGLVDLYIQEGKPVGSNTLRSHGFDDLSSATIRNYFARLEREGYLQQQHASGGRIPTARAYQEFADLHQHATVIADQDRKVIEGLKCETKETATYLQSVAQHLSELSHMAVFLTAPRFDHDFVLEIKLVALDVSRCLCVLVTDFGSVLTEILHTNTKLSSEALRRMEHHFTWRLTGQEPPEPLPQEELRRAQRFYNELMVRYITRYSSFSEPDLHRTGFSNLLEHPEFKSAAALANGLALFESPAMMRRILHDCEKGGALRYWIGGELKPYIPSATHCSVLATPYSIGQQAVGAIGILGPMRMPYLRLFGILAHLSDQVTESLTRSLSRYRIQYRQPTTGTLYLPQGERRLLVQTSQALLKETDVDNG